MREKEFTIQLKKRLIIEFKKHDCSGIYGFMQCSFAYNSNKIEGNTLTEKQTTSIFETGTLYTDDPSVNFRIKDIEEMTGHFKMFIYTLQYMDEPLSETIICQMHQKLKEGVYEDSMNGYAAGTYKIRANRVADIKTASPTDVQSQMQALLNDYLNIPKPELKDLARLHATFENIHPFQDGNGRVGRMILCKECLKHDIVPVLIRDKNRSEYMRHLNTAQTKQNLHDLITYFQEEQQVFCTETEDMLFDYQTLKRLHEMKHSSTDDH